LRGFTIAFLCCQLALGWLPVAGCKRQPALAPEAVYANATLLRRRGNLAEALRLAEEGSQRFRSDPHSEWHWKFRLLKAEVLLTEGNASEAAALLRQSAPIPSDNPEIEARLLLDRGWAEFSLSDFPESERLLSESLQLATSHGLRSLVTEIELRRGAVLARLGNAAGSEADFRDALQLAKQSNDTYLEASALGNLGFLHMSTARYDEAIFRLNQGLVLFDRFQSKTATARVLNDLGYCYSQLGQPEKAAPLFKRAEQLAAEAGNLTDRQISLGRLGDWYQSQGQYQEALFYYERALDVARQSRSQYWVAKWLYTIAGTSIDMGKLAAAGQYNREAIDLEAQIGNPVERLIPQINSARIVAAAGRVDEAEKIYQAVIAAAGNLRDTEAPGVILEARERLADLLVNAHRDRQAEAEFQLALSLLNTTRAGLKREDFRISYFASLSRLYQDYVDFLVAQHRETEALKVAESCRARVLTEQLGGFDSRRHPADASAYRQLARDSKTVLLCYWLAPRRSFLWVINASKVAMFTLAPQPEISSLVEAYQTSIEQLRDPVREGSSTGRKLYEILLRPAEAMLPAGARVAIVPDGALHNLNFESLPAGGAQPGYWIDNFTMSIIPSLNLLLHRAHRVPAGNGSILVIGAPLPREGYGELRYAKLEIDDLKREYPQAVVRAGPAANPGAYAASRPAQFSIIHFSAHAEANHSDPLDSAIIMSPQGDAYKLYARDVLNVPIRASLVTLSACHGAGSRTYAGEGLVGFGWAFLRAGAGNVIAGLWEVDDGSTAQLMSTMYGELRRNGSATQALRRAKLSLRQSSGPYSKPYYWAPFQVITGSLGP
jgi:CHAT domain-containing protein/Tfp pilus assembly protein PilF